MPGPSSFTGEDQAELHLHGSMAVKAAMLRALSAEAGLRAAEPGEFTRRAFLSGRMDLSAVEGLADLIDAETEAQRRQALRQLEGALAAKVAEWRDGLIEASSLVEAGLDFSDQEDVSATTTAEAREIAACILREMEGELHRAASGERVRDGFVVVLAGPPNAGKSTLLNAIARREVAIVSPHAGTTRDALEVRCDLGGAAVTFIDTAGLRETADPVERQGVARTLERAAAADLVLWLSPAGEEAGPAPSLVGGPATVRVVTKCDLGSEGHEGGLAVSAVTGAGMPALLEAVRGAAEGGLAGAGDALVTRERQRLALQDAADALGRAASAELAGQDELIAEDLRLALRALGRITGHVDVEAILDRIFAQFCVGK